MEKTVSIPEHFTIECLSATHSTWLEASRHATIIKVDCTNLHYLSTAAAQLCCALLHTAKQENKAVRFVNIPDKIRSTLHTLGLSHHFH